MRGSKPLKNPEETGSDWGGFGGGKGGKGAARALPGLQPEVRDDTVAGRQTRLFRVVSYARPD